MMRSYYDSVIYRKIQRYGIKYDVRLSPENESQSEYFKISLFSVIC